MRKLTDMSKEKKFQIAFLLLVILLFLFACFLGPILRPHGHINSNTNYGHDVDTGDHDSNYDDSSDSGSSYEDFYETDSDSGSSYGDFYETDSDSGSSYGDFYDSDSGGDWGDSGDGWDGGDW